MLARLRNADAAALVPVVVALIVLLPGIGWGLPTARDSDSTFPWGLDEQAPLPPLVEARAKFARPPGGYLQYPLFHYIVLTIGYGPYLGYEWATGHFRPTSGFPYGMDDPARICGSLTLIARGIAVLMAIGCVLVAAAISRAIGASRWVAAGVGMGVALLPTFAYYGRTSNVDVPYVFWLLLAIRAVADVAVLGRVTVAPFVRFGIFAALAVCTKDQAYAFLVPLPPLLLAALWSRTSKELRLGQRCLRVLFHRPLWIGFAASLIAFALANNLVTGFGGFREHVRWTLRQAGEYREHGAVAADQLALLLESASQLGLTVGPLLVLTIIGLIRLARERRYAVLYMLLAPVVAHQVLVIASVGYCYPRFVLLPAILATIAAGSASFAGPWRVVSLGLAGLSFAYLALSSADLTRAQLTDARYDAAAFLKDRATAGQKVESYFRYSRLLPPLPAGVAVELVPPAGMNAASLVERDPDFIILTTLSDAAVLTAPAHAEYVAGLNSGKLGYSEVFDRQTPGFLSRHFVRGTCPRVTILARRPKGQPPLAPSR